MNENPKRRAVNISDEERSLLDELVATRESQTVAAEKANADAARVREIVNILRDEHRLPNWYLAKVLDVSPARVSKIGSTKPRLAEAV